MNPPKKRTTGARIHGQHTVISCILAHWQRTVWITRNPRSTPRRAAGLLRRQRCPQRSAASAQPLSECLPAPEVEKRTLNFTWNRHWIARTVFKEHSWRTHTCSSQSLLLWTWLSKPCGAAEEQTGGTEFTTRVLHRPSEFWQRCRHLQWGKDLFIKRGLEITE